MSDRNEPLSSGALGNVQLSSVLADPALLTLCFLHLDSSADFKAASQVCRTWHDCLRPENRPLWLGFLQRHLTDLLVWEHASRGPGRSWRLLPDERDEDVMIGWREPSSKYEACNVPWTLFSSVLCSLHGTFSNVASVNMDQLPPDCNPHSVAVDLVWLHELGELMQAEGCWKLVLLPGPHQRHPESCWDAINTSSMPSSTSIYRDERFGSIYCDGKPLQVPLQFHKVFGSGFERAARCVVGRCSEGNVIYVGNVISNYSKQSRAFATLPGYMGFIGMSPEGNVIGAIAIDAEARCKSYAHGIWPDWSDHEGRHCEIL